MEKHKTEAAPTNCICFCCSFSQRNFWFRLQGTETMKFVVWPSMVCNHRIETLLLWTGQSIWSSVSLPVSRASLQKFRNVRTLYFAGLQNSCFLHSETWDVIQFFLAIQWWILSLLSWAAYCFIVVFRNRAKLPNGFPFRASASTFWGFDCCVFSSGWQHIVKPEQIQVGPVLSEHG